MSTMQKKYSCCSPRLLFKCLCRIVQHHKRSWAVSSADTSDCCCNGSSLRTYTWSN